jgi:urease accessory protein
MTDLTLIRHLPDRRPTPDDETKLIALRADRITLAKRRWRGHAEDNREFGFDLSVPLVHGDYFFIQDASAYVVEQKPESVLEIKVATLEEAAAIAWQIGNLHLGLQVLPTSLRVVDDPSAAQLFEREHITFQRRNEVFLPVIGAHSHHAHE